MDGNGDGNLMPVFTKLYLIYQFIFGILFTGKPTNI